jgi:hypothetical protein
MLCLPRNRLRNITSVGVNTIRKLKSQAKANADTALANITPVASMPCNAYAFPHTASHGKQESPPKKIHT